MQWNKRLERKVQEKEKEKPELLQVGRGNSTGKDEKGIVRKGKLVQNQK